MFSTFKLAFVGFILFQQTFALGKQDNSAPCLSAVTFSNEEQLEIHQEAERRLFWNQAKLNTPLMVAFVVGFAGFYFGQPYVANLGQFRLVKFLGLLFSPFMIANIFSESLKGSLKQVYNYGKTWLPIQDSLHALEKDLEYYVLEIKFERVRDRLSEDQVNYVTQKLRVIRQHYVNLDDKTMPSKGNNGENKLQSTLKAIEAVMQLPHCRKELELSGEVEQEIDRMLINFPEKVKYDVKLSAFNLIRASSEISSSSLKKKQILYFLGPPGTGKTTLARKYAKALKLPFIEISLSGVKIEELNGARHFYSMDDEIDFKKLSLFTSALLNHKNEQGERFSNAIILLDEVDKALNSNDWESKALKAYLLMLLDPDVTKSTLSDVGFDYDVSGHTFILAGNKPIKNQALRSRMKTIVFEPFDLNSRKDIAKTYFVEKANSTGLEITEEQVAFVDRMATFDPNPGVRSLLYVIDDYINHSLATKSGWLHADFDYREGFMRYSPGEDNDTELNDDQLALIKGMSQGLKESLAKPVEDKTEDKKSKVIE